MNLKEQFEADLKLCPVVAILRGIPVDDVETVCGFLFDAGIRLVEIPLNTPSALKCIDRAVTAFPDLLIGAGTVLTAQDVDDVAACGGKFIISPNTDGEVIRRTKEKGLLSMPGFFTATEGFEAVKNGADYLKLFPAVLGPGYVKDLQAVIKTPIFAVGGVNAGNIPDFLKCCSGVGIGSAIYKPGKTMDDIRRDAVAIVNSAKHTA